MAPVGRLPGPLGSTGMRLQVLYKVVLRDEALQLDPPHPFRLSSLHGLLHGIWHIVADGCAQRGDHCSIHGGW